MNLELSENADSRTDIASKKETPTDRAHLNAVVRFVQFLHLSQFLRLVLRPIVFLVAIVAFDLWELRAERYAVAYPVDASVHTAMVRFAASRIAAGHLPWTSWFPSIAFGSPQFLHYQGLAAAIGGLIAQFTTPGAAVAWSTYLLFALWPICVYWCTRLFGLSPWASAGAAICSPFLSSAFESGYEPRAYIFLGYELWTQLFAMWTLPIAWGLTWRAMNRGSESQQHAQAHDAGGAAHAVARAGKRRFVSLYGLHFFAGLLVALTICLHFETGYLALLALLVFPWVVPRDALRRLASAGAIALVALVVSAWAWVPLIAQRKWSAINSVLAGTRYAKGYGAGQMLGWLFTGQVFDKNTAMPIITILGGLGLVMSLVMWRFRPELRAIVCITICSFLLECGVTTFGFVATWIPGHQDLFFRRFAVGIQLAWLLLAGFGIATLFEACAFLLNRTESRRRAGDTADTNARSNNRSDGTSGIGTGGSGALRKPAAVGRLARWVAVGCILAFLGSGLGAAVSRVSSLDSENSRAISFQRFDDNIQGPLLNRLVSTMSRLGPGRVYAGTTSNWGATFTVGGVPVYKFLQTEGVDVMVYSPTTTSLMDDPEYYFDEQDPGEYALFGIRYLILPPTKRPYVASRLVQTETYYDLWEVDGPSYFQVVETVGTVTENRGNIGLQTRGYLRSRMPALGQYLTVGYEGAPAAAPTEPESDTATSDSETARAGSLDLTGNPGTVLSETESSASGSFTARVRADQTAVVALSVTYDPGWTAYVDGHRAPTQMLAPALLGVRVGPGTHTVRFAYVGYPDYPYLFGVADLIIVGGFVFLTIDALMRFRERRSRYQV